MSYVLRDYQQKASDAAVSFFNNKAKKTNAIMVLPTGKWQINYLFVCLFYFSQKFQQ